MKKRMNETHRFIELFVKAGLIAAVATVLLIPTTVKVSGSESSSHVERTGPMLKPASWQTLPVQPIPYLETMPWLGWERSSKSFKIDTLIEPKCELMKPATAGKGEACSPAPVHTSDALEASNNG